MSHHRVDGGRPSLMQHAPLWARTGHAAAQQACLGSLAVVFDALGPKSPFARLA